MIIFILIIISGIHLALDSPILDPKSKFVKALRIIDIVLTALFTLEAVLKIIAMGVYKNGPKSYFRSLWNILDFIIVLVSVKYILDSFRLFR